MSRYDDLGRVWDDRAFKAAADATDQPVRWLVKGSVVLVLAIAAIVLGGWWIGWWFTGQDVNRESHIIRNSYSNQQTLRDQITQNLGTVQSITVQITESKGQTAQALRAQRYAVAQIVCQDASEVVGDPLPLDEAAFIHTNCQYGNVRAGSNLATGVNP